jgi:peroxin-1
LAYIAIQSGKILEGSAQSIVLTNNSYFNVAPSERVLIQFNTARKGLFGSNAPQVSGADEEQYCIFSRKQFEGCQVEIGTPQTVKFDEPDIDPEAPSELVLGGVDETFNKILEYAKTSIVKHSLRAALAVPGKKDTTGEANVMSKPINRARLIFTESGGVLLTGSHGSGKTSMIDQVINTLKNDPQALTCKFSSMIPTYAACTC